MRDIGWTVMYIFLMLEVAIVAALILPMPSNTIRGFLIDSIRKAWTNFPYVQYTFALVLVLDVLMFSDSMNYIYSNDHSGHNKIEYFRHQQHAYLTGFSVGLFFVMNRLLDLNTQLYDARELMKRQEKAKKDA